MGLAPCGPLRVLYFQAEETADDLNECLRGFHSSTGVNKAMTRRLDKNWCVISIVGRSGEEFVDVVSEEINAWKPDVIVTDPLLAFVGCDLVAQEKVTEFLRTSMGGLIQHHRIGWICTHHASKASGRGGAGSRVNRALGTIEISAFFRGIIDIDQHPKDPSLLVVEIAKRARQAQLKNPDGSLSRRVLLKTGENDISFTVVPDVAIGRSFSTPGMPNGRPPKADPKKVALFIAQQRSASKSPKEVVDAVAKEFGYSAKQAGRKVKG
jgi:RecA-family ATPase